MGELATIEYGAIFRRSYRRELESMRDKALKESSQVLRREVESSIRQRWYDTGATVESLEEEIVEQGDTKTYRLSPTTFYAPFGEYGTGQRGARTGQPAPTGWTYGNQPGMEARRFSRIAVDVARPQVDDIWRLKVREFAAELSR